MDIYCMLSTKSTTDCSTSYMFGATLHSSAFAPSSDILRVLLSSWSSHRSLSTLQPISPNEEHSSDAVQGDQKQR